MSADAARARLLRIFRAALAAVDPAVVLRGAISHDPRGRLCIAGEPLADATRLHLLAAGKAGASMAAAACALAGDRIAGGLVVTQHGPAEASIARPGLAVVEAGHPVPDVRSARAGRAALERVAAVPAEDVLLVLLSGGASSLLACPAPGVELADLAETTRLLLASGAPIDALNAVRKHLSATAGGGLALARGAGPVHVLAISDVAGDRLDVLGSGPFAPDPTRYADAVDVLRGRGLWSRVPARVRERLEQGLRGVLPETPDAAHPVFGRIHHHVLASNRTALDAARRAAASEALEPVVIDAELAGEAREAGARIAAALARRAGGPARCLLAGGETTVTVRGDGHGGRSQELALAAAIALDGVSGVALLAAGTDGADGPTDAAGAFVDGGTLARGRAVGEDASERLRRNDSHAFFAAEGGLLRTGPTGTNVRDLVIASAAGPGSPAPC